MKENTLFTKSKFFAFVVTVFLLQINAFCQKTDSISITKFLNPSNLSNINEKTRDSVLSLIGKDERLFEVYYYYDARLLLQTGKFDEAQKLAKDRVTNLPAEFPEFAKAKYYNIIGSVYASTQNPKKAISYFEKALRLSEEAHVDTYAGMMENNIANMYFTMVDYESSYEHISKGYQLMKDYPEHPFYGNLMAVLSISEAKVGKMTEAKKHGQIALKSADNKKDIVAIIVANLALGEVANSEKNFEEAIQHLNTSLELSEKYRQVPFIVLNSIGLTVANIETGNFTTAVMHGERALELVNKGGDQSTLYSIKKNLAAAYFGNNQSEKSYELMKESHDIFRETNSIENKKAINDILLKYDSEKKQRDLISKKNELLQKEVERNELIQLIGLLIVLVVALGFIIGYIRYRNKSRISLLTIQQEKKLKQAVVDGEEVERERIARELHDGVASELTAVRYQLLANDKLPEADKTKLGDLLLRAHEDTRRLSHNLTPISLENFGLEKALAQFAQENSTETCEVISSLTPPGLQLPKDKATVLYRVAQELTQNAIKHAQASEISIQIIVDHGISLIVEDDGSGFDFNQKKDSNGISSIMKRATQLKGNFEIDSSSNNGTIATFTIP